MKQARSLRLSCAAAAAIACAMTWPAHAAVTTYATSASFTAAVTQAFTDTFNDLALDALPSPSMRMNGPYGYTLGANGGLYGAGSMADVWLSTNLSGATITFDNFTGNVRGLAGSFFGSNLEGQFAAGQTITVTATDAQGASATTTLTNATLSSFAGFVSTNSYLTSVTVSVADVGAWATVNNLVLASANTPVIPEPGTWALLAAGLAAVGGVARRRRPALQSAQFVC